MIISTDNSDCFTQTDIILEDDKEYIIYIATCFASSHPIVQMYSKYNPIFICESDENVLDVVHQNYLTLNAQCRTRIQNDLTTFSKAVSESDLVANLLAALKQRQPHVWIKTFENYLEYQPLFTDNVKSLSLTPEQTHKWNNKIEQYRQFVDLVPTPDFIITSKHEAANSFDKLASSRGVITSLPRKGQGKGICLHTNKVALREYISQQSEESFLLMSALSVKSAPSIDILIANQNEILIYGLADQIFDGFACLGAIYPASSSKKSMERCYEIANKVGIKLAEDGVRGVVGIDFIIDEDDCVYFCELNARYSGTTHNRMLSLEHKVPQNRPSMADLEIMAIQEGTFNGHQLPMRSEDVFWYKREIFPKYSGTVRCLEISNDAVKLAQLGKGTVIVGQRKEGAFAIKNKTSLGNLICMGRTKEELNESIQIGNALVDQYVPEGVLLGNNA